VLGITMVTGNAWRDEETLHTLRMLELTGHADVPVAKGAVFPLVRTQQETRSSGARRQGDVAGRVGPGPTTLVETPGGVTPVTPAILNSHGPYDIPPMPEGMPTLKPIDEDAAHFLIRQVRAHPHQVTIYAAGPLTNIALAIAIDPEFAALTKGIVLMGGSLNPQTDDPEFATSPRHEFNFWFDPEAAHIVLRADWPRIDVTTVDVSIKAPFTQKMLDEISEVADAQPRATSPHGARTATTCGTSSPRARGSIPRSSPKRAALHGCDLSHGPSYGDTLTWTEKLKPATGVRLVHAQVDLDLPRFQKMFVELMTRAPAK
jgi:purine nucleosidase